MELSKLRAELLEQHADLRRRVVEITELLEHGADVRPLLGELFVALVLHNLHEEERLHVILPTVDAWGPVRDGLLDTRHRDEHAAILAGLERAAADSRGTSLLEALAELVGHMDREEREILGADVLRDDLITSGVGG